MQSPTDYPILVFVIYFIMLFTAARIGRAFLRARRDADDDFREHFGLVAASVLALLGLIIGFSFSIAATRYDQRKNYEEEEANAIGTEYARADLLPDADRVKVRSLLRRYLDERIAFYLTRDEQALRQLDLRTTTLQGKLWAAVVAAATPNPTPVNALAVAGMNDVLNAQGYTQAAFWNRIPVAGWALMTVIAVGCNLLIGYGDGGAARPGTCLLSVLPLLAAVAFMLIADIDTPRHGIIRVRPQNLISLTESLPPQPPDPPRLAGVGTVIVTSERHARRAVG